MFPPLPCRTLQELLKQPGGDMSPVDGTISSSSTIGANGISARMLRSRSGKILRPFCPLILYVYAKIFCAQNVYILKCMSKYDINKFS